MARAKIVQQKLQKKLFETVCVTRNIQTGQKTKSESSSLHLGLEYCKILPLTSKQLPIFTETNEKTQRKIIQKTFEFTIKYSKKINTLPQNLF